LPGFFSFLGLPPGHGADSVRLSGRFWYLHLMRHYPID
jgi:hypothetical protein